MIGVILLKDSEDFWVSFIIKGISGDFFYR